jgi:hypothetical protein
MQDGVGMDHLHLMDQKSVSAIPGTPALFAGRPRRWWCVPFNSFLSFNWHANDLDRSELSPLAATAAGGGGCTQLH